MAVPKLEQLSKSVVQGPSLATGAIPTRDWMDIPAVFKEGNYAYPAKKEKVEYLNSQSGLHFPMPVSGRLRMTIGNSRKTGRRSFSTA